MSLITPPTGMRPPTLRETSAQSQSSNLRSFAELLWRRRLVVVLVLALVAAVVGIGLAVAARSYTATARVAATPAQQQSSSPVNYGDLLGTVADVAESRPVLTQVSKAIGDRTVKQLQQHVVGSVVTGTVLIQVSVTDRDPIKAAQIANAIVDALPNYDPSAGSFMFRTTEPASVPLTFTSPNIKVSLLAGVLLALAAAIAAAVIYDRLARTVETPEEATAATGSGVLGVVTRPKHVDGVPAGDPKSAEFASLRALRVALEFASSDNPTRSLVVAPVVRDPWSGWLEVNLAVALAEVGHRVLLIDANRTDRHRHPAFGRGDGRGLYDLLIGEVALNDASYDGPVDGVTIVPLGHADEAAPSLLEMRFRRFLDGIDQQYDVILIHAAPVTESDDARIMAIGGGALVTIPSGKVKRSLLEHAVADLHEARTRVLGAVLLGSKHRKRQG